MAPPPRLIFQRSLIREFSLTAISVIGILLAIMLTRLLIVWLGKAAEGVVIPEAVMGLIAFGIINYMPVLLGISVFVAVLLALTRSYRDSEMTVWFSSGLSIADWVKPVLQFAVPVAIVCALLSFAAAPWAQEQSSEYTRLLESRDEVSSVTPGVFRESRTADRVFFVDKLTERSDVVNNIFVQSTQNNRMGVMVAKSGFIETAPNGDRFIVLREGRRYEGTPGTLDYRTVDFDRYAIRIEPREVKRDSSPATRALGTLQLYQQGKPEQMAELHWRLSLPIAVVLMALCAVPLAFVNPRSGRSWNLVFAILVYALYNSLLQIAQAKTAQGAIPGWLGLFPVHAVMATVVGWLYYRQVKGFAPSRSRG